MISLELWLDVGMKPPKLGKAFFFEITNFTSAVQIKEFCRNGSPPEMVQPISDGDQEEMETGRGEGKNNPKQREVLFLFRFPSMYALVF